MHIGFRRNLVKALMDAELYIHQHAERLKRTAHSEDCPPNAFPVDAFRAFHGLLERQIAHLRRRVRLLDGVHSAVLRSQIAELDSHLIESKIDLALIMERIATNDFTRPGKNARAYC